MEQVSKEGGSGIGFKYEKNPSDNPKVLRDAIETLMLCMDTGLEKMKV